MKQLAREMIRKFVFHAPWGVREALLDACIDRMSPIEVGARLLPKLKIVEIGAAGDRGIVTSAWNDRGVLPEYAATGTFAETVTRSLIDFFANVGGTFIDIGANIGLTTIPIARNPLVHCIAFEPEPVNFEFLKRNVIRNAPGSSVDFHQCALSHSRSTMLLAIADGNIGDHRLTHGAVPGRRSIEIQAVPLDDFLERITGRLAVKIDTQGAEPYVVAGGQKALAKAGLLAIEFCPFLMKQLGGDPSIVIELIMGFDRAAVMTGGRAETPRFLGMAEVRRILENKLISAEASDADYLDILAIRED